MRIAIAVRHDPALHALALSADAELILDPHVHTASAEVGVVQDEAMLIRARWPRRDWAAFASSFGMPR